ncbi:MAG: YqzL family protein [Clostridia bacterium]|jgi:hypothetical protein
MTDLVWKLFEKSGSVNYYNLYKCLEKVVEWEDFDYEEDYSELQEKKINVAHN